MQAAAMIGLDWGIGLDLYDVQRRTRKNNLSQGNVRIRTELEDE